MADDVGKPTLWMSGSVGAEKSTLATTIYTDLTAERELVAYQSFVRGKSNAGQELRALAFNLARLDRTIASNILSADVANFTYYPLDVQAKRLVPEPMSQSVKTLPRRLFIIVDGLDECDDAYQLYDMLLKLAEVARHSRTVKILVASRPRQDIALRLGLEGALVDKLELSMDTDESKEGVRKYVFAKLRNGLALAVPFSDYKELEEAIEGLSRRAGGSFIHASLSIRATLRSASWNRKLRELLNGSRPDGLDGFYISALCSPLAGNGGGGGGGEAFAKIMGLVICDK